MSSYVEMYLLSAMEKIWLTAIFPVVSDLTSEINMFFGVNFFFKIRNTKIISYYNP